MNPASLLSFDAVNKTDAIIIEATQKIPYHAQKYIRENLESEETKDMLDFVRKAFGDMMIDKRDTKFTKAKAFYLRLKQGREYYNFTDKEIEKIISLTASRKPGEIVNILFEGTIESGEANSRANSVKALQVALGREYKGPAEVLHEVDDIQDGEYRPPLTDETVIRKINRADGGADMAKHRLSSFERKCVRVLKANLGLKKFCLTINSFKKIQERELFEIEFIRATYNKPDMIPDDINACMMLCGEYIREMQIREMMNLLDGRVKSSLEGDEKTNMVFAENLSAKTNELDKCQKNIKALQDTLNKSYSKRKDTESKYHESLARYINAVCDQGNREKFILKSKVYAEKVLMTEIQKIKDTPQEIGEAHGMGINEILGFSHQITD
jgi:hypothetical protein